MAMPERRLDGQGGINSEGGERVQEFGFRVRTYDGELVKRVLTAHQKYAERHALLASQIPLQLPRN